MEFTYKDSRVRVSFIYNTEIVFTYNNKVKKEEFWGREALRNVGNNRILTYCQIASKPVASNKADWKGLAVGFSIRNPQDQFSKATGRKLALQAATCQLEDHQLRKAIWDQYKIEHRDGQNFTG